MTATATLPSPRSNVYERIKAIGPRVCIVAPNIFGFLSGRADLAGVGGGAERQLTLIARALAQRDFSVSVVALDHGQPDAFDCTTPVSNACREKAVFESTDDSEPRASARAVIGTSCALLGDGATEPVVSSDRVRKWRDDDSIGRVIVFRSYKPNDGIPGLRFLHPRFTGIWRAIDRANPNIVIQRCADDVTGMVGLWCRWHGKPFVFSAASDSDCVRSLPNLRTRRERWFFRFGLRSTARVIAQTKRQKSLIEREFGIRSMFIPSCAPDPMSSGEFAPDTTKLEARRVLWVGRNSPVKRLDFLIAVARLCPDITIEVAGVSREQAAKCNLVAPVNVQFLGAIPPDQIGPIYDRASLLICTSKWEGFPNTFLEAWSRGIPVLSTVDPDDVIATNGLGAIGDTEAEISTAIRNAFADRTCWESTAHKARAYFVKHHRIDTTANAYASLIGELT